MKNQREATGSLAVEARGVSKVFPGETEVRALDDVSVAIRGNEFFTLLGPSGCGKTTLLRVFAGFEAPSAGTVWLGGQDITRLPPNKRPVNTVFQNYALFPHMTVAQNIAFGLEMLGKPDAEVRQTVDEMLRLVRMEELKSRRTAELSGGQQQRVALARALAPHPEVLLLDEPLSALDLKLRKEMQVELKRLQSETGITFVFVTHDQEEALTMSDRVGVMSDGRILQIGSPREIYNSPVNRFVADFIGETNFLTGRIEAGAVRLATGERIAVATDRPEGSEVTVAVRPEQLRIGGAGQGEGQGEGQGKGKGQGEGLSATVAGAVYFGTDTHFDLQLGDGSRLVARLQNPPSGDPGLAPGTKVTVRLPEGAARVLED